MSKHSFPAKLSQREYGVLQGYNAAQFTKGALNDTSERLWVRGLLIRQKDHALDGTGTAWFKLSKRGALMLQRFDITRAPRDWRPNVNRGMWGNPL